MSNSPLETVPRLIQGEPPKMLVRALKRQIAPIETARRPREEAAVFCGYDL